MLLAKVVGTVVATRKDPRLEGKKLLIVLPLTPEEVEAGAQQPKPPAKAGYLIAVDTVGAGYRETVLIVQGSSARMASTCRDTPVDTAIVGVVDSVRLDVAPHK